ncbi:MAG: hypothetical protein K0Q79_1369 [Flavipsychrobacter sp.]|jgi:hypothetical protein|nr:hypothetical protein [Flavipsychrobacter sp.]
MRKKYLISILSVFVVLSIVFCAMRFYMNIPYDRFATLETGNTIMALLALTTYTMVMKQKEKSAQAFVRGVSGASFLKLMVCMISILVYILVNRAEVHKPTVFMLFGIYAVYTIIETWLLSKSARE